jgi:quercetin dioxygenase-like cupin family protein
MRNTIRPKSFLKSGRLTSDSAKHLKSRSVKLASGEEMPRHTTGAREELIIVISGKILLLLEGEKKTRSIALVSGKSIFIPKNTWHGVLNKSKSPARYVYVTA